MQSDLEVSMIFVRFRFGTILKTYFNAAKTFQRHSNKGTILKCYIVLPCYNEAENLETLLDSIDKSLNKKIPYKVIAVNDGSTDNTEKVLRELSLKYPIEIVEHPKNLGLAEALKTGFKKVLKYVNDDDYVVFMDSDNTHNPKYIPLMITTAEKFDLVVGSRYIKNGGQTNVPYIRIFLSRAINHLIKLLLKVEIEDFTSGYRCFKASAIKRMHEIFGDNIIESQGFEVSFEVLLKSLTCNFKVSEIPIILNYGLKNGKSKMNILLTVLSYVRFILCLKNKIRMYASDNS